MNFAFIQKLIEKGLLTPAGGRLIEASIVSILAYSLTALATGEVFNAQAVINAGIMPLALFFRKRQADLLDNEKK